MTDPARRGQGLGRRMIAALLYWARRHGADAACLQVQSDNTAAQALYASVGLTRNLYGYHYRAVAAGPN